MLLGAIVRGHMIYCVARIANEAGDSLSSSVDNLLKTKLWRSPRWTNRPRASCFATLKQAAPTPPFRLPDLNGI